MKSRNRLDFYYRKVAGNPRVRTSMNERTKPASPALYRVTYVYDNPSPAGPQRGSAVVDSPLAKGELFYAVMGRAIVTRCVRLDTKSEAGVRARVSA